MFIPPFFTESHIKELGRMDENYTFVYYVPGPNFDSYVFTICLAAHVTVFKCSFFFCAVHLGEDANCVAVCNTIQM